MSKKEIVINEARKLFTKYGYKKVSMDEIASNANVTKKTVYSYFKDKDELYSYFIKEEIEKIRIKIEKLETSDISFVEKVSKDIYYMLVFRKKSLLFKNVLQENNNLRKLYDQDVLLYIEEKIKKGIEEGKIKECNTHLTAFIIYKVYLALLFEYDEDLNEIEVTKKITSILKDGLFN